MTAKEWRNMNSEFAKNGNMRDYTDLQHLIILNNLENINAELIKRGISQQERLTSLNQTAKKQMKILNGNKNIDKLEMLQNQVNNNN